MFAGKAGVLGQTEVAASVMATGSSSPSALLQQHSLEISIRHVSYWGSTQLAVHIQAGAACYLCSQ